MSPDALSHPNHSLSDRIAAWSAEHASDFPKEVLELFAAKTEELIQSDILENSVMEGETSPDLKLPDTFGNEISLAEKITQGPVILSFYRGTWCPYCTIEFQALLELMPNFRNRNATVLAVSPQIKERYSDPKTAGFFDLSDEGNRVARSFGLVYPLGDEIRKVYTNFGIRLGELNGEDSYEVPIPATYLIDQNRIIRYAHANADITQRAEPEALLDTLAGLAAA